MISRQIGKVGANIGVARTRADHAFGIRRSRQERRRGRTSPTLTRFARDLDFDSVLLIISSLGDGLQIRANLDGPATLLDALPGIGILLTRMLAPRPAPTDSAFTESKS